MVRVLGKRIFTALETAAPPLLRRFVRQKDGATAVEFSLIAVPFLGILFAIIETALVFFASQIMETATSDAARLIMTGQAQNASFTAQGFKNEVCSRLSGMFDCQNGVFIDVRKYEAFSAVDMSRPVDADGKFINNFKYEPGGPGCITVVRVFYQWPIRLAIGSYDMSNMQNGKRLLTASAAFRNEPYATGGGAC
ncbi:MAG TPA: TadE/TadG family type IV pilus assembly protein [Xanthobacteraceae bacterium]|nr:TadE/TadG family type IV pilus assembly protein [Xanthobacteraceae bacterium]